MPDIEGLVGSGIPKSSFIMKLEVNHLLIARGTVSKKGGNKGAKGAKRSHKSKGIKRPAAKKSDNGAGASPARSAPAKSHKKAGGKKGGKSGAKKGGKRSAKK